MTQTLTAAAELSYSPPRVRLDFTDTSGTPVTSVTITRQDASGRSYTVRTSDGGPLVVSGGVATVWDYEVPYGQTVTYSTDISGGPTATAMLAVTRPWLIHPGVPSRSITFTHGAGSHASETWDIVQGSFTVLRRSTPIITTGGARVAAASTLVILISNAAELSALSLLLSDGSPLYLNVPPALSWGVESCYIAVGRAQVDRQVPVLTGRYRAVTLPYQVVARPGGGTQAGIIWDTIAGQYAAWTDLAATGLTWAQLVAPTS